MYVHAFGAYFGLAVSFVIGLKNKPTENPLEGSSYQSDIFAMIGNFFQQSILKLKILFKLNKIFKLLYIKSLETLR